MVKRIRKYKNVGEIIIIDNGSTYEPLLRWYETTDCTVLRNDNIGHRAPWLTGVTKALNTDFYVVTDPDLDLSQTPDDTLLYLREKLLDSGLRKLGLMLDLEAVRPGMYYYDYLQWYEAGRRKMSPVINDLMIKLPVDTTFAMYPKCEMNYFVGGGSTMPPYQAGHIPWLYTPETMKADAEYQYYLQHANGSASITSFLKDKNWVK